MIKSICFSVVIFVFICCSSEAPEGRSNLEGQFFYNHDGVYHEIHIDSKGVARLFDVNNTNVFIGNVDKETNSIVRNGEEIIRISYSSIWLKKDNDTLNIYPIDSLLVLSNSEEMDSRIDYLYRSYIFNIKDSIVNYNNDSNSSSLDFILEDEQIPLESGR